MLNLPPSVQILVCSAPTDMRRSFDGLAAQVRNTMGCDPLSGHIFVFRNRNGDRLKILFWDRTGFWILYKRLETGKFQFPVNDQGYIDITSADLMLILEGIDLSGCTRRRRYGGPGRKSKTTTPANMLQKSITA